jgi:DNA mismatch repair protein MutL
LNLTVNPQTIDINIHPTKTEIKFDDEHTLYALLRSAVKHSLGQFNIAPVLDFERDATLDTPYSYKDNGADTPKIEVDRSFNPFKESVGSGKQTTAFKTQTANNWDSLYMGLESKGNDFQQDFGEVYFESEEQTVSLFDDEKQTEKVYATHQIHNKYIVSTIKSGMLVMDQHRAHQRILYEEFLQNMTVKEASSQQLLFPLQLHFTPQELVLIEQLQADLEHTGFVFSNVSKELVEIIGVPVSVPESEVSINLEQLISDVENEVPDSNFSATDLLAKSMAKSLAIKTGQSLEKDEQEHLVNRLFGCKEPNVSPTNRRTFITMSVDELDKKFI